MKKGTKKILKLNDIVDTMDGAEIGGTLGGKIFLSGANVDDIFRLLKTKGIDEVKIDWNTMVMITSFIVANLPKVVDYDESYWEALRMIKEGMVDKYFGVKLYLE